MPPPACTLATFCPNVLSPRLHNTIRPLQLPAAVHRPPSTRLPVTPVVRGAPSIPPPCHVVPAAVNVFKSKYGVVDITLTPGAAISTSRFACEKLAAASLASTAASDMTDA